MSVSPQAPFRQQPPPSRVCGAWSSPNSANGLSDIGGFAFTGQELDIETGLYYYGARYYDPNLGRFLSADTHVTDPLDTQAYGRYTYCRNNPVTYIDPSGHEWWNNWNDFCNALGNVGKAVVSVVATVIVSVWGICNYLKDIDNIKNANGWLAYVWWQDDSLQIGGIFFGSNGIVALNGYYNFYTGELDINGKVVLKIDTPGKGKDDESPSSTKTADNKPSSTPGQVPEKVDEGGNKQQDNLKTSKENLYLYTQISVDGNIFPDPNNYFVVPNSDGTSSWYSRTEAMGGIRNVWSPIDDLIFLPALGKIFNSIFGKTELNLEKEILQPSPKFDDFLKGEEWFIKQLAPEAADYYKKLAPKISEINRYKLIQEFSEKFKIPFPFKE